MGFLNRIFGKKTRPPKDEEPLDLAFVLLSKARLPSAKAVVRCYREFEPKARLSEAAREGTDPATGEILMLHLDTGETAFVALMPAPVPDGEADGAAQCSVSSLGTGWKLPAHSAHLIVTMTHSDSRFSALDRLSRFTSLLAAVAKASASVGIYWGNAGATHDPQFFYSIAADPGVVPRIMLWTGVSVADEGEGRLSILSLGMQQLGLPDLLLVASESAEDVALETFFDLLAYVANRGKALPEGDTVGRTAEERLPVHYVDSPIDKAKKVWRVELP